MANTKSAQKNMRKSANLRDHNRGIKSRLKTLQKKAVTTAQSDDKEAAKAAASEYISALEKASKSNIVHPNKVKRHKSDFAKAIYA